jgi:hypothetical protein
MSLSRLDDKADRVLLHDTYRKIDFTFEREGVQKEPETPTNAPDSNAAANVAVPQNH